MENCIHLEKSNLLKRHLKVGIWSQTIASLIALNMSPFFLFHFIVDMVSYLANVDKLLELYQEAGTPDAIRRLWKSTFEGRRSEVLTEQFNSVELILKKRCPVLRDPVYVSLSPKECSCKE